jgi:hypothetical protein
MRVKAHQLQEKHMANVNTSVRQRGSGYLIVETGIPKLVMWEVEVSNGFIGSGYLQGNRRDLSAASQRDRSTLLLTSEIVLDIVIDKFDGNQARFHTVSAHRRTQN